MKVGQIMILIVIFLFVFYYMYLFVHVKWAKAIWLEGPEYVCYFWEVFGRKNKILSAQCRPQDPHMTKLTKAL